MTRRNQRYCTLLALAGFDRAVTITVRVPETFADGAGAQTEFQIGETQVSDETNLRTMRAMSAATKSGAGQKLGTQLLMAQRTMATMQRNGVRMSNDIMARAVPGMRVRDGYIAVTAFAIGEVATLKTDLEKSELAV